METDRPTPTTPPTTTHRSRSRAPLVLLLLLAAAVAGACWLVARGSDFGGGAAGDLASVVREGRIQAVYMANDDVYFGDLEAAEGGWIRLRDAYFLRAGAAEQSQDDEEAPATSLVPVQQQVGGDGALLLNASEVTLVQNLASDSTISEQIEDARQ